MANLTKRRHSTICPKCNGNGYVKVVHIDEKDHIHQCWECDSEGEFYVYEPPFMERDDAHGTRNTYKFLH